MVQRECYAAFWGLIDARFQSSNEQIMNKVDGKELQKQRIEEDRKQAYLKLVMRHGLLYALGHLETGVNTKYIDLTMFLLQQMTKMVQEMGVNAVLYLKDLCPLVRGVLMEEFVMGVSMVVLCVLELAEGIVKVLEERVSEKWWVELLRGLVGGWCAVIVEEEEGNDGGKLEEARKRLKEVTREWEGVVEKG